MALLVRALSPNAPSPLWFVNLTDPINALLLWIFFASGLLATASYARSRRGTTRALGLGVTVILAVVTFLLAMASYWDCAGAEAAPFAQLYWTMALFVGNLEKFTGLGRCASTVPLSLQLARLTALTATFTGIAGILVAVSKRRLDSFVARHARRVVVVIGLEPDLAGVLRSLALQLDPGTHLVVVDSSGDPKVALEARSAGASLVALNVSVFETLEEVLTRRKRIVANEIYLLGSNLPDTVQIVRGVEAAMRGHAVSPGLISRLIVRIDDPWVAQNWRRTHITARDPWLADAVSLFEETARHAIERARIAGVEHIVIAGRSPLSLAILGNMAQSRRESRMLSRAAPGNHSGQDRQLPSVVLVGDGAQDLLADHEKVQLGFGNDAELQMVEVLGAPVTVESLVAIVDARPSSMVVLADPPDESRGVGTRLAATRPDLTVLEWSSAAAGMPDEPLMGRLYSFGLTLVGRDGAPPVDNWTRLARLLHEEYVLGSSVASGEVPPSRRPWDSGLPPFYQASNLRQLSCLISGVTSLGRSWAAPVTEKLSGGSEWTDAEIEVLAEAEHQSWVEFYRAHGWKQGSRRDDKKLRHNLLLDWNDLTELSRHATRDSVRRGLVLLESLGYRSTKAAWQEYRRLGHVSAQRLLAADTWISEEGSILEAKAGDWRVSSDDGRAWTVDHGIFQDSYRQVGGDRYQRVGTVKARRAKPGEEIDTMEGKDSAGAGDWVVEGPAGDRWIVTESHFVDAYEKAK